MKVIVCGSMKTCKKMIELKNELKKAGHEVLLPRYTEEYARLNTSDHVHKESVKNKVNHDLIRDYYNEIQKGNAILVVNEELNDIEGYIGGNTFLEMGFAHVLNKKIFLLNEIPKMGYTDEIVALQPIVLNGDLTKIN